ncbi:MAG: S9 family peptidase [Chitinophagaceae bacterium]|jgi:dipeptidyl aminopeptidase/acylaminoacyl peptidase
MKKQLLTVAVLAGGAAMAQSKMTPEMLWSLNRVSAGALSADGRSVYISSKKYDLKTEKGNTKQFAVNIASGKKTRFNSAEGKNIFQQTENVWYASDDNFIYRSTDEGISWANLRAIIKDAENFKISPDGKYIAYSKEVLVEPTLAKDVYKDMPKSTAQIYTDLNYRHWDKWSDGKFAHVFIEPVKGGSAKDLLQDMPFDCPQKPHGGADDFTWSPNSDALVYVCKKKSGKEYAISTNTDLYLYNISTASTVNLTEGMMGYDMNPAFSGDGKFLAFTSMKTDGFEADKNDIVVMDMASKYKRNMTSHWDETVGGFTWSKNNTEIYFTAPWKGTEQLFSVMVPGNLMARNLPVIDQITEGDFDIAGIVGEAKNEIIVSRTDWNHAAEIYAVDKENGGMRAITQENDAMYSTIKMSKISKRFIKTTDGKEMFAWVIYPPDFNPNKKYPTLLYCQGGPQGALSQFYSFRWNFQLMAAQGYIVIAPNRRGMPGWGVKWNADISKDWGGQPMDDYLSAIDDISKERYVDKEKLGCVGASYGGYSVFMLAGIHNNRFKTFISHCGLFDLKSWYGTTEELWFANWDIGGNYWSKNAPESYSKFSPSNYVNNWNTPIMVIQGGMDFRVPIEQGQQAFQAAQLKGLKSKFLFFPNENHWILHAQNAIVWQREYFKWLEETLK